MTLIILAAIGLTNIVVDSSIAEKLKAWLRIERWPILAELLACKMCSGFWAGLLVALGAGYWADAVLIGLAVSLLASWLDWLQIGLLTLINRQSPETTS